MTPDKLKLLAPLLTQLITLLVGILTLFGITLDPEMVEAFKAQVSELGAQLMGLVLVGSAVTGSVQEIIKRIRSAK